MKIFYLGIFALATAAGRVESAGGLLFLDTVHQRHQIDRPVCTEQRHIKPDPHIHALLLKVGDKIAVLRRVGRLMIALDREAPEFQNSAPDSKQIFQSQIMKQRRGLTKRLFLLRNRIGQFSDEWFAIIVKNPHNLFVA